MSIITNRFIRFYFYADKNASIRFIYDASTLKKKKKKGKKKEKKKTTDR